MHPSHYGRMCPIETPEGPNIGLIGYLASFARINRFGFIETPYRKVEKGRVTDEIVYLAADDEDEYVIAQANARVDEQGNFLDERVLVRAGRGEIGYVTPGRGPVHGRVAEAARVGRDRARSRSSSTTTPTARSWAPTCNGRPFRCCGRPRRTSVPVSRRRAARRGRRAPRRRRRHGHRRLGRHRHRRVQDERSRHAPPREVPPLEPGHLHQPEADRRRRATQVQEGRRARRRSVDAPTASSRSARTCSSRSCRGRVTTSRTRSSSRERLVKDDVLTSIHIEEHEIDARDTKLGAEEITRDIPNLSEDILKDLDERGIIRIGAEVGPGDILVGKVTPKGETELTPEERLLRAIFGEKAREVRDTSLKVPHGETGKVIDVRVFARDDGHELPPGVNQLVRVYVGAEAQDQRGRQARRPARQQGCDLQDPPDRGHAVPRRRHAGRHRAQPARCPEPYERRPGARSAPRLRGAPRLDAEQTKPDRAPNKTRTITEPAVWIATPGVRRRALGRGRRRPVPRRRSRSCSRTSTPTAPTVSS